MFTTKLKIAAVILLAAGMFGAGADTMTYRAVAQSDSKREEVSKTKPEEKTSKKESVKEDLAKQKPVKELPKATVIERAREIRKILNTPTEAFRAGIPQGTPLHEALDTISKAIDVSFRIDEATFKQEAEADIRNKPVMVPESRGMAAGTILRDMLLRLEPCPGAYLVRGDHVEIVTANHALPLPFFKHEIHHFTSWKILNDEFSGVPLDEALATLADTTGTTILMDRRLGEKARTPVTASLQQVSLHNAVRLLADMCDLKMVALENVLYVTTEENAGKLEEEEEARKLKNAVPPKSKLPGGA